MKIISLTDRDPVNLQFERARSAVFVLLRGGCGFRLLNAGYIEYADTGSFRYDLFQKLEPFHCRLEFLEHQSGYVSARSRKTGDQTVSDWVTDYRYDNGNGRCRLLCCSRARCSMGYD